MHTKEKFEDLGLNRQREIVSRVIRNAERHLTANEISEQSKQYLPDISFATVCNSLRYLKDAGHIGKINFASGANRFDRRTSRHDHAFCTICGKLVDIELDLPSELVRKAAEYSQFKLESIEFTLRGLCPDCNK